MLANKVQLKAAVRVWPEPAFSPVKSCTVVVAARKVPERDGHRISGHPLPVLRVFPVAHSSKPILAIGVTLVTSPQFPGEESLQRGIGFVYQGTPTSVAELKSSFEVWRLLVVKDVALPVVGGRAAGRLVAERGAAFDRQCLVNYAVCSMDYREAVTWGINVAKLII